MCCTCSDARKISNEYVWREVPDQEIKVKVACQGQLEYDCFCKSYDTC